MTSQTKERGNASKKGVRSVPLLHEMSTDAPSAPLRLTPRASLVMDVRGCGQTTASSTETKKAESVPVPAASSTYRPSAAKARTRIKTSLIQRPPIKALPIRPTEHKVGWGVSFSLFLGTFTRGRLSVPCPLIPDLAILTGRLWICLVHLDS